MDVMTGVSIASGSSRKSAQIRTKESMRCSSSPEASRSSNSRRDRSVRRSASCPLVCRGAPANSMHRATMGAINNIGACNLFSFIIRAYGAGRDAKCRVCTQTLTAPMDRAFALYPSANRLPLEHLPRAAVFAGRAQHYQQFVFGCLGYRIRDAVAVPSSFYGSFCGSFQGHVVFEDFPYLVFR